MENNNNKPCGAGRHHQGSAKQNQSNCKPHPDVAETRITRAPEIFKLPSDPYPDFGALPCCLCCGNKNIAVHTKWEPTFIPRLGWRIGLCEACANTLVSPGEAHIRMSQVIDREVKKDLAVLIAEAMEKVTVGYSNQGVA